MANILEVNGVEKKYPGVIANQGVSLHVRESSIHAIIGENGAGKSTISQVITFGLYGKLEGKKLKDIPNRINGNAWVRITLDHQSMDVIIERGLDPNIFRIFLGGKEFDQAGSRSLQDFWSTTS